MERRQLARKGILIAFEGIDGSGKNTQIRLLARSLKPKPAIFRYPDLKGRLGARLASFLKGEKPLSPLQQFKLFSSDIRKDSKKITRLLNGGKTVILDRFISSTVAYQSANGLSFPEAARLAKALRLPLPQLTILLDMPAKAALERKWKQKEKSSLHEFEKDLRFQGRVRRNYLKLAARGFFSENWLVANAMRPRFSIQAKIKAKMRLSAK